MAFFDLTNLSESKALSNLGPLIFGKEASYPVKNFIFAVLGRSNGDKNDFDAALT